MLNPKLIGIIGAAGAGKDTIADILSIHRDYVKDSFAAPMYAGLAAMLGVSVETLQDRDLKEVPFPGLDVTPRRMLQTLGTEWGRHLIAPNIWLTLAKQRHMMRAEPTVIADVRFVNEADWILEAGGILLRVKRDSATLVEAHASEGALDDYPVAVTIVNNGAISDLSRWVLALF